MDIDVLFATSSPHVSMPTYVHFQMPLLPLPKRTKPKKVNIVQVVWFMKIPWVEIVFEYVAGNLMIVDARRKN